MTHSVLRPTIVGLISLVFVTAASADGIGTDRPGNANAASVVPPRNLNLETSFLFADQAGGQSLAFPTVLRFGVFRNFELRAGSALLGGNYPDMGDSDHGLHDVFFGFKYHIVKARGSTPDVVLSTDVSFPVGADAFTSDIVLPDIRAAFGWSLGSSLSLTLNGGFDFPEDADGRYANLVHIANIALTPPFLGRRLMFFIETYGKITIGSPVGDQFQFDWGLAYLLRSNLQLDFYLQHGIADASPDLQFSLGLSRRF